MILEKQAFHVNAVNREKIKICVIIFFCTLRRCASYFSLLSICTLKTRTWQEDCFTTSQILIDVCMSNFAMFLVRCISSYLVDAKTTSWRRLHSKQCSLIFYNWVYSLINHKKKSLLSVFKDLINQCDWIEFNERAIICIIRINQEIFIDKIFENWMRAQKINWNWSTKNIFEQNEKFKCFDELLIEETKCIKKHAKLSKDFYSKCYLVVTYILNRTSLSSLNWDSSLIFMKKLLKTSIQNKIAHFKMFNCKTFSLLKKINAFKKMKKWNLERSSNIW